MLLIRIVSHSRMLKRGVLKKISDLTISNQIIALSSFIHDIFFLSGLLPHINLRLVFIYLFTFSLFKNATTISDYIVSEDSMTMIN